MMTYSARLPVVVDDVLLMVKIKRLTLMSQLEDHDDDEDDMAHAMGGMSVQVR